MDFLRTKTSEPNSAPIGPNADIVLGLSKRGCVILQTGGGKKAKKSAYVLNGSPLIIVISIHLHLRWIDHKVNHNVNRGQEDRSRERMYIQVNDMHRSHVHR